MISIDIEFQTYNTFDFDADVWFFIVNEKRYYSFLFSIYLCKWRLDINLWDRRLFKEWELATGNKSYLLSIRLDSKCYYIGEYNGYIISKILAVYNNIKWKLNAWKYWVKWRWHGSCLTNILYTFRKLIRDNWRESAVGAPTYASRRIISYDEYEDRILKRFEKGKGVWHSLDTIPHIKWRPNVLRNWYNLWIDGTDTPGYVGSWIDYLPEPHVLPWKWADFLFHVGLATSKSDARRALQNKEYWLVKYPTEWEWIETKDPYPSSGFYKVAGAQKLEVDPEAMAEIYSEDRIWRGKPTWTNTRGREIIFENDLKYGDKPYITYGKEFPYYCSFGSVEAIVHLVLPNDIE